MAIASSAFVPSPPMDPTDKQKYRTRLASAATSPKTAMNLHVSIGAHNLRILKKAGGSGGAAVDTPRSTASAPTPTGSKQRKYERKSKRFLWPDELHRLFVAAIFDVGLKNASPKALLSIMLGAGANNDLTTEHLKSHLQKYRLNYERSRLEFLEFYDESARRSYNRHRKSSGGDGGSNSDHNSGFVFPISHKRRRTMRGGDASSDDGIGSEASSEMEDQSAGPIESPREDDQRNLGNVAPSHEAPVLVETEVVANDARRRSSPAAAAFSTPGVVDEVTATPFGTSPQPLESGGAQIRVADGISDRMVVAAAAAAVASVPYSTLSTLNDPQWNILNSLISPQLGAGRPLADASKDHAPGGSTSTTTLGSASKALGSFEQFSLSSSESADLQVQMHLAMQAQMNLHRQMLTRKVEVSQHLQNHQQQLQQQHQQSQAKAAAELPSSSIWNNARDAAVGKNPGLSNATAFDQISTVLQPSQPPISRLFGGALSGTASTTVPTLTDSDPSAPVSLALSSALTVETATPLSAESSVSSTLLGLQAADFVDAAALASLESVAGEKLDEGDSLADLYRWDKMDFSMDLEDDDLFGFLKS